MDVGYNNIGAPQQLPAQQPPAAANQAKQITEPYDCTCEGQNNSGFSEFRILQQNQSSPYMDCICCTCGRAQRLTAEVDANGNKVRDKQGRVKLHKAKKMSTSAAGTPKTKGGQTDMLNIKNPRKGDAFMNKDIQEGEKPETVAKKVFKTKQAAKKELESSYNGARVFKAHEDVCGEGTPKGICPFTKEREEYKDEHKVIQPVAGTGKKDQRGRSKPINPYQNSWVNQEHKKKSCDPACKGSQEQKKSRGCTCKASRFAELKEEEVGKNVRDILAAPFDGSHSEAQRQSLLKTASMYDSVYMQTDKTQWCPKLRRAVSQFICGTYCIDGRRKPQVKEAEVYTDYIMKGGQDNGEIECGYKAWMMREMDRYYPGWVEDHIRKAGGEVVGSDTEHGNRKMNLEDGERRHLPRYPEEKLIEKQLEERQHYVPDVKTSGAKKLATKNAKKNQ